MRRLILIRHGVSQSNAGQATQDEAAIEIIEEGRGQAQAVADNWVLGPPDKVVVSSFRRTQQTAAPMLRRFGLVAEIWPVAKEFTYLSRPSTATTPEQRRTFVEQYWGAADPHWRDKDSESFSDFFQRGLDFGERAAQSNCSLILVFTHGLFTTLFDYQCSNPQARVDGDLMKHFDQLRRSPLANGKSLHYYLTPKGWRRTLDGGALDGLPADGRE